MSAICAPYKVLIVVILPHKKMHQFLLFARHTFSLLGGAFQRRKIVISLWREEERDGGAAEFGKS